MKRENGITLTILVITIIVMFIFAGVIIKISANDKIIEDTKSSVNDVQEQVNKQEQITNDIRNLYK